MQSQTSDDAIPRNLIIFVGGLKLLVVTVARLRDFQHAADGHTRMFMT